MVSPWTSTGQGPFLQMGYRQTFLDLRKDHHELLMSFLFAACICVWSNLWSKESIQQISSKESIIHWMIVYIYIYVCIHIYLYYMYIYILSWYWFETGTYTKTLYRSPRTSKHRNWHIVFTCIWVVSDHVWHWMTDLSGTSWYPMTLPFQQHGDFCLNPRLHGGRQARRYQAIKKMTQYTMKRAWGTEQWPIRHITSYTIHIYISTLFFKCTVGQWNG